MITTTIQNGKTRKISYTYVYYDPRNNEPFYVGKGIDSSSDRHLTEEFHETKNFHKYAKITNIQNAGLTPIIKRFIKETEQEAYDLEEFLTHFWGLESEGGILTNLIHGGRGGWKDVPKSEEHKQKIGESNRLAAKNPETKQRKSEALKGNTNGKSNKGRVFTEEWKKKISDSKKKQFLENPESHPRTGTHHSNESKEKMSASKKGKIPNREYFSREQHPNFGLKREESTKKAIADALSDTWEVIDPNGKKEIITNLNAYCREHGIASSNLGKYGHTKGFKAVKLP